MSSERLQQITVTSEQENVSPPSGSADTRQGIDRLLYRRTWTRTEMPAVSSVEPGPWMVFMDPIGLGDQISQQLRGAQHQVIEVRPGKAFTRVRKGEYLIRPGCRADYDALIVDVTNRGGFPHRITHLWSVCDDARNAELDEVLDLSFYSLLGLAQALSHLGMSGIDIAVVSNRLQPVSGELTAEPIRAALLGPIRVIPKEMPGITCRSIDCDPVGQGTGYVAVQIIAEHLAPFSDPVVAYRSNERWTESVERLDLKDAGSRPGLKFKGTYLITDGLGSLGLVAAESLARNYQANLIFVDHTALPAQSEWPKLLLSPGVPEHTRLVLQKLVEIQSLGSELLVICADISRHDAAKRALELAHQKFRSINGVIHAASVSEGGLVPLNTRESAIRVLDTKIKATLVLADLLRSEPLDFFALFSSVSSFIPGKGQIDEAAASAFLDAFSLSQQNKSILTIDWGPWRSVDSMERPNVDQSSALAAEGTILPSEKAEALTRILSTNTPSIVVVFPQDLLAVTATPKVGTRRCAATTISKDNVEGVLSDWWQELLNLEQVGLDDDFFDLGGHSLIGLQLFGKIKSTYGLNLGLATLFEARTVRQLSELIREAGRSDQQKPKPWSPIVPIQPKGTRPPLYVISGIGGNVIKFHSLAFHLGEDQPMYGLLPRGLDGKNSFLTRIEDMAAYYVDAIRTMQPTGPYFLVGYSFGGLVAFEVAQQIVAQGGKVQFLGLFDSVEWHYADRVNKSLRPGERMDVLKEHLNTMVFSSDRFAYSKKLLNGKFSRLKYRFLQSLGRPLPQNVGDLEEINSFAATKYDPKVYPGKLTLFRSTKRVVQQGSDEYLGWKEFAGAGVEVHHVPSTHFDILQEPGVSVIAEKLRGCLGL